MENLINLLFPPKCLFCQTEGSLFCKDCLAKCPILFNKYCVVCDQITLSGNTHPWCNKPGSPTSSISIFVYDGYIRKCIKESKYGLKQFLALKVLSKYAASLWKSKEISGFIAVPIPISKNKEKLRGFNQTYVIAKELKIPVDNKALIRVKDTKSQFKIGRTERFKNLSDAFLANRERVQGKNILIVDDICTTGATLLEASRVLYQNGAKEVKCFTLAKSLKRMI